MLNITIEDNLNNSDLNSEENNWFDELNDNIPKLPTNGMPHAAYEMIISQPVFNYLYTQTYPQHFGWQLPVPQHPLQLLEELLVSS